MEKINLKMILLRFRFDRIEERNVTIQMTFRKINLADVGRSDFDSDDFLYVRE